MTDVTELRTVVCVKHVPAGSPVIGADGRAVLGEGLRFEANEADLYALEEALAQRARHGGSVTAVTVGPAAAREALFAAMAAGADSGVHVVGETSGHDDVVSRGLVGVIAELGCELVLTGIQASDDLLGLSGVLLAEQLGVPVVTGVVGLEVDTVLRTALVTRELAGGYRQELAVPLPCVLTVQLGLRPLRYVPVMALVKARRRSVRAVELGSVAPPAASPCHVPSTRLVGVTPPPRRDGCEVIKGSPAEAAETLVSRLALAGLIGDR